MSMTWERRYANDNGGRKYAVNGRFCRSGLGSDGYAKGAEKEGTSELSKAVWKRVIAVEGYKKPNALCQREKKE